ncbi:hypothetical protein BDQ94DRAFT_164062 [Aspergillus welwitschiae]|uniref:Uncharacterized protein n=1 Tax=Aspergillus welwitschiae TaxID=1341132 RepID=A0A3F3PJ81_9EURO|nr:hypothetical protein BDQ94DRAFT_164062 [Aspergillus welwitschiae]RDH26948.1 hypothetical protein BDQ94DRAFT_164062 [Aspergillus welwitschiae]
MNKLGNIYGEHELLSRLFLVPLHQGYHASCMVMTVWALSTAMIWGLVIHQRDSESWDGRVEVRSSTSNPPCCEPTELVMRHESNKRRGRRRHRPHQAHHTHRPN